MVFAQIVLGPPGSGKTTYVFAAGEYMKGHLGRKVCIVNIDPACEGHSPRCSSQDTKSTVQNTGSADTEESDGQLFDIDVRSLIRVDEVMERLQLGPNAALVFCMEFLEQNLDWLKEQLDRYQEYTVILDCPGQVELYTHHRSIRKLVEAMQNAWHWRVCCVHLVDSYMCSDPNTFMSALLVSMSAMMMLELPHINVLSKIDLVEKYGRLHFNLDFYTEVLDLHYLVEQLDNGSGGQYRVRYKALTSALAELVQDYALVHFLTLNVQSAESLHTLIQNIDKAVGNLYIGNSESKVPLEGAVVKQPPLHETHGFTATAQYLNK
eukprot:gene8799-10321_t